MNFILNHNIAGLIGDYPNGIHITQLAKQTNVDEVTLSKVLRFLATNHIFREGWFFVDSNPSNAEFVFVG